MSLVERRLDILADADAANLLCHGLVGLEKESLRVAEAGCIAASAHPAALGSPLTHPWITTDYSESLLELITPPFPGGSAALAYLGDLHRYVFQHLGEELLWATSMPCVLHGEEHIPIARYGTSNPGRMKHIYRVGLGYRYGRVMQVIAGAHFNYSLATAFWEPYREALGQPKRVLRRFADEQYMGLIRNLQRVGWLVPYLFGASPAVCKSFFVGKKSRLQEFDANTFYEPYATSLRMGDIGYQNRREQGVGVQVCYDSLGAYVKSLLRAIETPALPWQEIGVKRDGEYRQLNANILQIENEYYSTVRPKQILDGLEKPALALRRRGIAYVELRSLDVNAYHPLGVDETQIRFLETLMLYCLLADSPTIGMQERWEIDRNLEKVAHRGRDPRLRLVHGAKGVSLRDWGGEVLDQMHAIAEVLDTGSELGGYRQALRQQEEKLSDPELTPSGRMLREMQERGEGFYDLARRLSVQHAEQFRQQTIQAERAREWDQEATRSIEQQRAMEDAPAEDFDRFLERYFAQT